MKRIPLYAYIATNNEKGTTDVITSFGLPRPTSHKDAVKKLRYLMVRHREDALEELAKVHPDRELILAGVEEPKSGGCGCTSGAGGNKDCDGCSCSSGADGNGNNGNGNAAPTADTPPTTTEAPKETPVTKTLTKAEDFAKNALPYMIAGAGVVVLFIAMKKAS